MVNNAGVVHSVFPVEWLNREDYDKTLAVNLYGVIFVTKAFLPLIIREKGRLVNMSSITARFPCVSAPYVISKFGVEAFSDTIRLENSGHGHSHISFSYIGCRERGGVVVVHRTSNREVLGSISTGGAVLCL